MYVDWVSVHFVNGLHTDVKVSGYGQRNDGSASMFCREVKPTRGRMIRWLGEDNSAAFPRWLGSHAHVMHAHAHVTRNNTRNILIIGVTIKQAQSSSFKDLHNYYINPWAPRFVGGGMPRQTSNSWTNSAIDPSSRHRRIATVTHRYRSILARHHRVAVVTVLRCYLRRPFEGVLQFRRRNKLCQSFFLAESKDTVTGF